MTVRILNESRIPKIGPFYYIDGAIYSDEEDVTDVSQVNGIKDSNNNHFKYWDWLCKIYSNDNTFKYKDYDYYPRGRVVYNVTEDMYYIYIDKCLDNNVEDIVSEFYIPRNKYKVKYDEHYQCHKCNPNYSFESMYN